MPRKPTPTLTAAELGIMNVLWKKGEATVNDVLDDMPSKNRPAYNTVLTILRILEEKDYVAHTKEGRAHLFRPLVGREVARQKAVRHMVKSFFDGSPKGLMLNMVESSELTADDLREIARQIEEKEREGKS